MGLTGLAQIALTLPVVGWHSWMDWLAVGRDAAHQYTLQESWIILSRDLVSIPRRWLLTFQDNLAVNPERRLPTVLGHALWYGVIGLTVLVALWRRRRVRAVDGPPAAFLMLGAYFGCFHFMYYDVMISALPVGLLFTEPRRYLRDLAWLRPLLLEPAGWLLGERARRYLALSLRPRAGRPARLAFAVARPTVPAAAHVQAGPGSPGPTGVLAHRGLLTDGQPARGPAPSPLLEETAVPPAPELRRPRKIIPLPPIFLALVIVLPPLCIAWDPTHHYPPMDTFSLLGLWAWCGYRTLRNTEGGSKEDRG
jgi:hypothetical protein